MSVPLREQRKARTRAALSSAALDLFAERGYATVPMSDIAAAAGVGERTLYRYFADKEELLFGEDATFRAALRDAVAARPPEEPPFRALRRGSRAVAERLHEREDEVRRRAAVVGAVPQLLARERAKHAAWEEVLTQSLTERGVSPSTSRLFARLAVACYDEAMARWLAHPPATRTLSAVLDEVFDEVVAQLGAAGP